MARAVWLWALLLGTSIGVASADVLRVPSAFPTVGAALYAAGPSDTVLVFSGTYTENLIWPPTNGIKLLSETGATATILDGGAQESVIGIYTGVDTTTVIRGFTIRNGYVHGM